MHCQRIIQKERKIHILNARHGLHQQERFPFRNRLRGGKPARFGDDDIRRIDIFLHIIHKAQDMHLIFIFHCGKPAFQALVPVSYTHLDVYKRQEL